MTRHLPVLALLLIGTAAQAAEAPLLTCTTRAQAQGQDFDATLRWLDGGTSELEVVTGSGARSRCTLELKRLSAQPRAVVPYLELVFERRSCAPELPESARSLLLTKVPVYVRMPAGAAGAKDVSLQWLRYTDLTSCKLSRYDDRRIAAGVSRWEQGNW
jgi:hypothetical protein